MASCLLIRGHVPFHMNPPLANRYRANIVKADLFGIYIQQPYITQVYNDGTKHSGHGISTPFHATMCLPVDAMIFWILYR